MRVIPYQTSNLAGVDLITPAYLQPSLTLQSQGALPPEEGALPGPSLQPPSLPPQSSSSAPAMPQAMIDALTQQQQQRQAAATAGTSGRSAGGNGNLPVIIYSSRTHSQLAQVIRELRNTSYRCDLHTGVSVNPGRPHPKFLQFEVEWPLAAIPGHLIKR